MIIFSLACTCENAPTLWFWNISKQYPFASFGDVPAWRANDNCSSSFAKHSSSSRCAKFQHKAWSIMTRLHRSISIFVVHPKCPNAWSDWKSARWIPQHPRKVKLATANFWPACADVSSPPSFFTFKISKRTASRASWSRSISPSLASINIASVSFCCSWSEWFCAWFVVLLRIKSTNSSCLSSPFKSIRFLWFNKKTCRAF